MSYNANTNFSNERKYLNNLISGGGGNAEWATHKMKELNAAEQKYGNSGGSSGGGSSGSRSGGRSGSVGGGSGGGTVSVATSNPYNENTNFANERAYLSNLMSNGNYGQQEWAKNRMGLLTATENEIMQQRLQQQQQQLQQLQLQQQQQQQQQVNDLSDYLRDIYRQQMQANLSALEGAYNANVTRLRRQGELAPQKYDAMRNLAAAQNELSRRNFGEYAAARGLNTGTSGQAELARSAELQRNLADLSAQEAEASGNLESELTALDQQYNAAVAQAQASGNADLANALYQELVRRQSAAAAQAEADAEQQRWLAEFEASRKDAADNLALAYAKLEASNRKSTGKGKSGTTDDIGKTTETVSRTASGNALLGTNGLPSYSDIRRTILTYMGQGNAASAQNVVNRYWKNMSAEQQNELSGLFGG